ncbi:hypothetical protein CEQ32_00855 [Shewanella sp. FDAARGOS_354]|nr:hypothetical protein CEQ32_00855 [Shewanella sp. FDAARGOS_354]
MLFLHQPVIVRNFIPLPHQTLQCIAKEYASRRKQFKKAKLNWRKSGGAKRSLCWIPVNTGAAKWKNSQVFFNGRYYSVWDSYGLSQYQFKTASFNEDARGRWYFNASIYISKLRYSQCRYRPWL